MPAGPLEKIWTDEIDFYGEQVCRSESGRGLKFPDAGRTQVKFKRN
jgi:hypothetical protein